MSSALAMLQGLRQKVKGNEYQDCRTLQVDMPAPSSVDVEFQNLTLKVPAGLRGKRLKMARAYVRNLICFYEEKEARKNHRTEIRELANVWALLPREEFLENYKVSPEMVQYLCEELKEDLAPRASHGYPVLVKVLAGLRILISGHYQRGNGQDQAISISQTTVSKYLYQFVNAVNNRLKPKWIIFPGTEEARHSIARGYQTRFRLPDILGAVDCTRITLFPPPGLEKVQYLDHHGDMSINCQLICDAECRILNVNADYPGRVHDQFIFNGSLVKEEMRRLHNNRIGEYYLLGDSGYALEPWLMTPIRGAAENTPEARYTQWHCAARNPIERTNGQLKGTFRMLGLDRNLHYAPEMASEMIYASCTLYNIMKHFRLPMREVEAVPEAQNAVPRDQPRRPDRLLQIATAKRAAIVNTYF